jgi:hypothetical protein
MYNHVNFRDCTVRFISLETDFIHPNKKFAAATKTLSFTTQNERSTIVSKNFLIRCAKVD